MNVDFPYRFDERRHTAQAGEDDHVRDLVEQLLFTAPTERVMRMDFGGGLLRIPFEPGGPELAATTQFVVQAALQQWLGHLIALETVDIAVDDATLTVSVAYVIRRTQERRQAQFSAAAGRA